MKKYVGCLFLLFLMLFLYTGCGRGVPQDSRWPLKPAEQTVAAEKHGVTMVLEAVDTGENAATFVARNDSDEVWYCGMDYALQVKQDGTWYEIGLYADAAAEEVILEPGEVWGFQVWWDAPYGTLPAGTYRLIKEFYGDGVLRSLTGWTLGCEFTIE